MNYLIASKFQTFGIQIHYCDEFNLICEYNVEYVYLGII